MAINLAFQMFLITVLFEEYSEMFRGAECKTFSGIVVS